MTHQLDPAETNYYAIAPEQRLFVGVVANAAKEAAGSVCGDERAASSALTQETALAWFTNAGEDFHTVCALAGLEPVMTRKRVLAYVGRVNEDPRNAVSNRRGRQAGSNSNGYGVTIREVADHAGVSTMTVKRALNGKGRCSPETRSRVIAAAEALGYLSTDRSDASVH